MHIPEVKRLAETYTVEQLKAAEEAILNEQAPEIEIHGDDEGEQLTHAIAAYWVIEEMQKENIPLAKAVRNYTVKVRNSIS